MQIQLEGLRIRHGDLEGVIANRSVASVQEVRLALFEHSASRAAERIRTRQPVELWDLRVAIPARGRRYFRCRLAARSAGHLGDGAPDARIVSVVDG